MFSLLAYNNFRWIDELNPNNESLLYIALKEKRPDIYYYLLENLANPNNGKALTSVLREAKDDKLERAIRNAESLLQQEKQPTVLGQRNAEFEAEAISRSKQVEDALRLQQVTAAMSTLGSSSSSIARGKKGAKAPQATVGGGGGGVSLQDAEIAAARAAAELIALEEREKRSSAAATSKGGKSKGGKSKSNT